MKKLLSILLSAVIFLSTFTAIGFTSVAEDDVFVGDIDGNGCVTASDARQILRFSAGLDSPVTTAQYLSSDFTGDDNINASDARIALRYSALLDTIENAAPTWSEPSDLQYETSTKSLTAGSICTISISASYAVGLESANMFFEFDTEYLEFISFDTLYEFSLSTGGQYSDGKISLAFVFLEECKENNIDIAEMTFKVVKSGNVSVNYDIYEWNGCELLADSVTVEFNDDTTEETTTLPTETTTVPAVTETYPVEETRPAPVVPEEDKCEQHTYSNSSAFCDNCGECVFDYVFASENEIWISGCKDTSITSVIVPERIDGYKVTGLEYDAFTNYDDESHPYCSNLEYIELPDGLIELNSWLFAETAVYQNEKNWENGVLYISNYLIDVKDDVTKVNIKENTTLTYSGFAGCYNLKEVNIPASMTESISEEAFGGCVSLECINVDPANKYYTSVDGVLFSKDMTVLYAYPAAKTDKNYNIPEGVTEIGFRAFAECSYLENVTVPEGVESLNGYAKAETGVFCYCKNLKKVTLPQTLTYIGDSVFEGCESLTEINIPEEVIYIGSYAFFLTGLTDITVPSKVENIEYLAIGYQMDYDTCIIDITPWFIIYGATGSAAETYANENGLTFIATDDKAPEVPVKPDNDILSYLTYAINDGEVTITGCDTSISGNVTIPDTIQGYPVITINNSAFENCSGITEITIPANVTYIGASAFAYCSGITEITIPANVTYIGASAFANCSKLENIVIGYNVEYIGRDVFYYTAYYDNTDNWEDGVLYLENYLIDVQNGITQCYIKEDTTVIAQNALINDDYYYDDDVILLEKITVDKNNKYFSNDGYGVLFNKDKTVLIQCPQGTSMSSYVIPDGVEKIGTNAFFGCSNIKEISIPDSVLTIEEYAFFDSGCFTNSDNWDEYGILYIDNCLITGYYDAQGDIIVKDGTRIIAESAFYYCSIESISIPDSVKAINTWAFLFCTSLEKINIPDSVTSIGNAAFAHCRIKTIEIPDSITTISDYTFSDCFFLEKVTIPDSVTSIGDEAFINCTNLKSVVIPSSVTQIGNKAFGYTYGELVINEHDDGEIAYSINYFDDGRIQFVDGFTIYGTRDSAAETYANENGITFISIGEGNSTEPTECSVSFNNENMYASVSAGKNGATVSLVKDSIGSYTVIYDKDDKKLTDSDVVGTGCIIVNEGVEYTVVVPSDVDGNGKISAADARLALRASALLDNLSGVYSAAADYDGDGKLTAADARMILRKSAGLE